ncbi:MAG: hypothetical protein GXZ08_09550 [Tissierellia bacterium]|nr:hypothetical protein [Tissierellia bacterium]
MDTILKYLDMSFSSLPNTPEIFRLKQEMAAHMEEKYNELKIEGKTENEAIGIVIAEFGSIDEIAEEFGLNINQKETVEDELVEVNLDMAFEYIDLKQRVSKQYGIGVFTILFGVAIFISIIAFSKGSDFFSSMGVVVMLPFIAIAVGIFIYASYSAKPWEYIEKGDFYISPFNANEIKNLQDGYRGKLAMYTVFSVILYIICPAIIITASIFEDLNDLDDYIVLISVSIVLIIVGIATLSLTYVYGRNSAYNALLKKDDYSVESKKAESIIGVVATVWWPLTTVIYLGISFFTDIGWGFSWVVWPISGVLFGAIAGAINIYSGKE